MQMNVIAGARMQPLDDDWRQTLSVDNGVLVISVAQGSPAKESGLHGSDVIISADGQPVMTVRALQRIVSEATANTVKLEVVRAGKKQTVTLRWGER
jgi:S1-C subfamily serine protease